MTGQATVQETLTVPDDLRQAVLDALPAGAAPGDQDNLFAHGLDSLTLIRLIGRWRREARVRVRFDELAARPTLADWAQVVAAASGSGQVVPPAPSDLVRVPDGEPWPLATMQHAYWIGRDPDQPYGGVAAHYYVELDGAQVDVDRLRTALAVLVARHGLLRTKFSDDGTAVSVGDGPDPQVEVHDLRRLDPTTLGERLSELRDRYTHQQLDIAAGRTLEVAVSLLPDGRTRLHVDLDMVAADAVSMRTLLADLRAAYVDPEEVAARPALGLSFADYLATERRDRAEERRADEEYWSARLDSLPGGPVLPVAPTAGTAPARSRRLHHWLSAEQVATLTRRAADHGLTPAALLATVFAETIGAWSSEGRFVLNLPLFQREDVHPDVAALVGDFSSSVLLEVDLREPATLVERTREVSATLAEAVAHGRCSGVEVLRDAARRRGAPVLAPVVYTSAIGLGELYEQEVCDTFGEPAWIISQGPQVWLDAQVTEFRGGLLVNWDVRDDVLRPGVPDRAFAFYGQLLDDLVNDPAAWDRTAPSGLSESERRVRDRVNGTTVERAPRLLHETIADLDPEWADRTAVADSAGAMTYAELAHASAAVARWLQDQGVGVGDTVAVTLPKGREQVVAVLGVLRRGATYLPIGTDQPAARAATMRRLGRVTVTIDAAAHAEALRPAETAGADGSVDAPVLDRAAAARRVAYVLFTSGSTGEPKGVEVSHAAAANTIDALNHRLGLGPADATLALSALEFDLSVYDLFAPLAVGGTVVLVGEDDRRDPEAWWRLIEQHGVTVWNSVPALLSLLLAAAPPTAGSTLRAALLGGDLIPVDLADRFHAVAPTARFWALGGMTEAAIHSTVAEIGSPAGPLPDGVPWGVPLDNVRCRVVDDRGRDCRDEVVGELWMGGASLADGYRGRTEATAERFVTVGGQRWYRTGDLASYRPDGTLLFHGRRDAQVQVLGHRIEPGEIAAALRELPAVDDAVVRVVRRHGATRLAAVVAGERASLSAAALRDHLIDRVPGYMVCDPIVVADRLPLSPNGKVVTTAVDAMVCAAMDDGATRPGDDEPRTPSERRVAAVWHELLRPARPVRTGDDFFSLGGDSLLATRATAALRRRGAEGARVAALLRATSLADYAASLTWREADGAGGPGDLRPMIEPRPDERHEPFAGTDVQQAYLLGRDPALPLGGVGTWQYAEFDAPPAGFDADAIARAWRRLVARHEMLRTTVDPDGMLTILPDAPPWDLPVRTVETAAALDRLREQWSHQLLDLSQAPLWHLELVRHPGGERLCVGLDYIVFDALSIMTLFTELDLLVADPEVELAPIELSFRDYLLQQTTDHEALEADQEHWRRRLAAMPPGPALPLARTEDSAQPRFERREHRLEPDRWRRLQETARTLRLTPSTVLLALYAHVLGRWSEHADLTITVTMFNRREVHPDIYRVLGDFTTVSLADYRPSEVSGWQEAAGALQARMADDLDHREVSSSWLLRELSRRNGRLESVPVVFTSGLGVGSWDRSALADGEPDGGGLPPEVSMDMSPGFGTRVHGISQSPQVSLDNQVTESADGLLITWDSVVGLFADGVVDSMFELYCDAVTACTDADADGGAAGTERLVAAVADVLSGLPAGQRAVREAVNDTALERAGRTLHGAVLARPAGRGAVALRGADGSAVTYRELRSRVLEAAAGLRALGVSPGDRVVVQMAKSPEQVVAVLAVLAAGGTYVPVGVDQPPARVARICAAARPALVLEDLDGLPRAEPLGAPVAGDPGDLAYIIFTSGSTGEPKGVEISHAAAANTVDDIIDRCGLNAADVVLASSALDFDLSVFDIFGALAVGAELVLPSEDDRRDAGRWAELVRRHGVTWWNSVPLLYDLLLGAASPGDLASLRQVLLSGDWVGLDLAERSAGPAPAARLLALGGATEAGIWSNAQPFDRAEPHWPSVPYGRPLSNQQYRVVDDLGRDRPDRAVGELWIGGRGLARGYCGDPGLTAERFVVDGSRRWYRTGDLGRYWPDGTLEFCGRRDAQVKVGGHRVELGEIESALERLPGVERAAAVLAPDRDRVLAAITGSAQAAGLRDLLRDEVPSYAVPARIEAVEQMPLTVNGKLDRAALTALLAEQHAPGAAPARRGLLADVLGMWAELGVVARDGGDNFFAAGGSSLAALRFVQAVERRWGVPYSARTFLAAPTVEDVCADLARLGVGSFEEGEL